jgi:hypothetical protein
MGSAHRFLIRRDGRRVWHGASVGEAIVQIQAAGLLVRMSQVLCLLTGARRLHLRSHARGKQHHISKLANALAGRALERVAQYLPKDTDFGLAQEGIMLAGHSVDIQSFFACKVLHRRRGSCFGLMRYTLLRARKSVIRPAKGCGTYFC